MIRSEFMAAVRQVANERQIDTEDVLQTLEHAMLAAYRKDYPSANMGEVAVNIDPETGEVSLVNEEGDDITPPGFGRIAAQTAKQVILQGVREAEKSAVIEDYKQKIGTVVSGMLQRRERNDWMVDIGRAIAILPRSEQVYSEEYRNNQRLKVYVQDIVEQENKADIIVSRAAPELVVALFKMEVPEIQTKAVEIKGIAREPGNRSKIAVTSNQEGVDPVGSMVGQRGVRVNAVTNELNDEKMDIILWNDNIALYIENALSPAKVHNVTVSESKKSALVEVPDDQLSLAIGKEGQNVRLAAKLTGFSIDIQSETTTVSATEMGDKEEQLADTKKELETLDLSTRILNILAKADITSLEALEKLSDKELEDLEGIDPKSVEEIRKKLLD